MNPIEAIKSHNIPTGSYVAAIQYLSDREHLTPNQYRARITEMGGVSSDISDTSARHTYLYMVQNAIKKSFNTDMFDVDKLFIQSVTDAETFIENNQYVFATIEDENEYNDGAPKKPKKGQRKIQAQELFNDLVVDGVMPTRKDVIALFVEELEMSKAGASTYAHNCKTNYPQGW